jgi:hypothetical protein
VGVGTRVGGGVDVGVEVAVGVGVKLGVSVGIEVGVGDGSGVLVGVGERVACSAVPVGSGVVQEVVRTRSRENTNVRFTLFPLTNCEVMDNRLSHRRGSVCQQVAGVGESKSANCITDTKTAQQVSLPKGRGPAVQESDVSGCHLSHVDLPCHALRCSIAFERAEGVAA